MKNVGLWLDKELVKKWVRDGLGRERLNEYLPKFKPREANPEELRAIAEEVFNTAKALFGKVKRLEAHLETPLLVGLGSPSPYEAHLHTSFPYGHPMIEASSVKGVARFYTEKFLKFGEEEIKEIFGHQESVGQVVWLPGLPLSYKVGYTIINVHYPEYYEGADFKEWEDPRLIHLPCVLPGAKFWFGVAGKNEQTLKRALDILRGALTTLGMGGKTRVGFGKFRVTHGK